MFELSVENAVTTVAVNDVSPVRVVAYPELYVVTPPATPSELVEAERVIALDTAVASAVTFKLPFRCVNEVIVIPFTYVPTAFVVRVSADPVRPDASSWRLLTAEASLDPLKMYVPFEVLELSVWNFVVLLPVALKMLNPESVVV